MTKRRPLKNSGNGNKNKNVAEIGDHGNINAETRFLAPTPRGEGSCYFAEKLFKAFDNVLYVKISPIFEKIISKY